MAIALLNYFSTAFDFDDRLQVLAVSLWYGLYLRLMLGLDGLRLWRCSLLSLLEHPFPD